MLRQSLSKRFNTISSKKEFFRIYNSAKAVSHSMVIFVATSENPAQVAFVASKKVGNAVKRNRAKRLMRAALREILAPDKLNLSTIIVARISILELPFANIVNDLRYCLKNAAKTLSH